MLSPESTGARCARHPEASAVAPCARCGTFLCGACIEVDGEGAYCADCFAWLHKHAVAPRILKGILALNVLALLSFPLCMIFPPLLNLLMAVLGLWLGTREVRHVREGRGARRGAWQARLVLGLATVNGLLVLGWGALVLYAVHQGSLG